MGFVYFLEKTCGEQLICNSKKEYLLHNLFHPTVQRVSSWLFWHCVFFGNERSLAFFLCFFLFTIYYNSEGNALRSQRTYQVIHKEKNNNYIPLTFCQRPASGGCRHRWNPHFFVDDRIGWDWDAVLVCEVCQLGPGVRFWEWFEPVKVFGYCGIRRWYIKANCIRPPTLFPSLFLW